MKSENEFKGKTIVLGVCSSIAAYKAADITSALVKLGAEVHVIMTKNAKEIISERVFATLSRNPVACDMWKQIDEWKPEHISLANKADVLLVAPATANTIGNFANGLAPDTLSSTYLATKAKVVIAPAMNCNMLGHEAVQKNIETLKSRGVIFVDAEEGALACGITAKGRLASLDKILDALKKLI